MSTNWQRLRKRAGSAAIQAFFESLSSGSRLSPRARDALSRVRLLEDLPYHVDGSPEHRLDVYIPRGDVSPRPCVFYVHGGGFRMLSKRTHWLMALQFASRGYVVFNVDYRLAPRHPFPAALQDVADAYRWVILHAGRYGADPSRLVVAGESAGGNLITALTAMTCFERTEPFAKQVYALNAVPVAAVPMCAMLYVSDPAHYWEHRQIKQLFRDRIETVCQGYLPDGMSTPSADLADILLLLESTTSPSRPLPPFFAGVGTADPIMEDTVRLEKALKERQVDSEVRYYSGETHAFHAFTWRENARRAWTDTFRFLGERVPGQGKLED